MENVCERGSRLRSVSEKCWGATNYYSGKEAVLRGYLGDKAVKRLSMREELRGNRYIRFGKATDMWLRLLAGKNREIFFVFQESSLAMNRKNKRNV